MTIPSACFVSRLIACLLVGCLSSPLIAEDWPEFRGPTGQGHSRETRLPTEWGPDKNVTWKTAIPGLGWSSPVLVKERIYLTTAQVAEGVISLELVIVDAASGDILKQRQVFTQDEKSAPGIHRKNSHASPTPLVVEGRVYLHFGHMGTACVDSDGEAVWTNRDLSYKPVHGNGGSPVYVDGLIVFTADGASDPLVIALDAKTGEVRWKYERPEVDSNRFAFATPLVIEVNGQQQVVAPGGGSVSGINAKDGSEIWRAYYGEGYSVIPRPVYAQGLVFVSSSYDRPTVLAIRPDGQGDVTKTHVAWDTDKNGPHTPSMLVVGEELYMISDGGVATCLDAKTGKQHWQQRIGGNFSASPVYADGKIYLQSEEGEGTVIAAGKKFKKLGSNGFGERTLASYAIGDGAIFVRTDKHLYRVQH